MVDSVYIVKSTPLRAFIWSFQHFEGMLQTYWRCAWRSLMQKKKNWQTYRVFILAIFSTLWIYVADILKMCMKKFDAEKIFFDLQSDMLSGTKIAGQLRKNSSGHATRIFAKKLRKFEIPAVRLKEFLQSCTCVSLTCIKNINITWLLIPLSGYPIRKPSVSEILHSLFIYTPVRDDPNDNRCTYNIDNQYCLMLNILGDTPFSGIKLIYWFCVSKVIRYLNILLPLWNNY